MKIPHNAKVVIANGEKFLLLRNAGEPFEPKLQKEQELDLLVTNYSAGIRHQDPQEQRGGFTELDELAHGAAVADWLNDKALKNELGEVVIVADPSTLGQIRKHLHKKTADQVAGEVAKDLTNQPMNAIERALAGA